MSGAEFRLNRRSEKGARFRLCEGRRMSNKKWKFGIGIGIILAVVAWEAISGFQQSKTYYVTVAELVSGKTSRTRVRVGGVVAPDSIQRRGGTLTFRLAQDAVSVPVT